MACLGRPHHYKFFKGCIPQVLLGPFLNTLTHLLVFRFFSIKPFIIRIPILSLSYLILISVIISDLILVKRPVIG